MKKTIALLLIAASAAATELPNCPMPIQRAINGMNGEPPVNCGFSIDQMITFQKVKNGYLAITNPEYGLDVSQDLIFIQTDAPLERNQRLAGNVTYVKPVTYQALDGFPHTVPGFLPVPVPASDPRAAAAAVPVVADEVKKKLEEIK